MNRLIVALLVCAPALTAACEPKEYAQYRDAAKSAGGRITMAYEFCRAGVQMRANQDQASLSVQGGRIVDSHLKEKQAESCQATRARILDALSAAKATNTLKFALADCKGEIDSSKP
jgi:hypothetical protein